MSNQIDFLYSYVLGHDTGFAPNPFFDVCTLACCKPAIRKGIANYILDKYNHRIIDGKKVEKSDKVESILNIAERGKFIEENYIWVVGSAGGDLAKTNKFDPGAVIYLMKVTNILTFKEYNNEQYKEKIPRHDAVHENEREYCGDNIYIFDDKNKYIRQLPSFHQSGSELDADNFIRDLKGKYVLLSDNYIYWGKKAKEINFELYKGEGQKKYLKGEDDDLLKKMEYFISQNFKPSGITNEIVGMPCEWKGKENT